MRQGLQFFVSILLARLLSPEDFGLLAMLYVFTGIAGLFIDSGFSSSLIQQQHITLEDESTVFFFNLGTGLIVALGLCSAAPWIAFFFEQPALQGLTYLMALNLFIGAFGAIQSTLMNKNLDFKTPMKIGAVASLVSGVLAVCLAWQGYGIWSLALQSLASTTVTIAMLWFLNPWRPSWTFSFGSLRSLFRVGSFLLLSSLLDTIYNRLYSVLIGKLFSVRDLGFYTRASGTQQLPTGVLTAVLNRVAFPIFAAASADKALLARGVRKALLSIMLLNIPAMLGMAVVAEPLVVTLFGEKWLPSVPILKVLCLSGVLWPLHVINLNVLIAQGHSNLFFRIEIIKKIVGVSAIIFASAYGLMAIAWSQLAVSVVCFLINAHYTGVLINYSAWHQTLDLIPYLIVGVSMSLVVIPIELYTTFSPQVKLTLMSVSGAIFYWLACRVLRLAAFEMFSVLGTQWAGSRFNLFFPYAKAMLFIVLTVWIWMAIWQLSSLGIFEEYWQLLTRLTFAIQNLLYTILQ